MQRVIYFFTDELFHSIWNKVRVFHYTFLGVTVWNLNLIFMSLSTKLKGWGMSYWCQVHHGHNLFLELYFHMLCLIFIGLGTRVHDNKTIRIHHECEGGIEKFVSRITDRHFEICQVMTNGDRQGQTFTPSSHKLWILFLAHY